MYNAELQMLREFFLLNAPRTVCYFCGQPILLREARMTFGHRRHPKVNASFTVHHDDENRENNADGNLKNCHSDCHRRYHKQLLLAAGKENRHDEKGKEGREEKKGDVNVHQPV